MPGYAGAFHCDLLRGPGELRVAGRLVGAGPPTALPRRARERGLAGAWLLAWPGGLPPTAPWPGYCGGCPCPGNCCWPACGAAAAGRVERGVVWLVQITPSKYRSWFSSLGSSYQPAFVGVPMRASLSRVAAPRRTRSTTCPHASARYAGR